jgi:hypothetical protein
MFLIGILLTLGGLGFFCWLLFTLAIYALPCFAGLWIGLFAYHSGAGFLGSGMLALIAAFVTFALGQIAFATVRSPLLRFMVASAYAGPACIAGYQVTLGLARIGAPSETWCQIFAVAGAIAVGATAWVRLTRFEFRQPRRAAASGQEQLAPVGATRGI